MGQVVQLIALVFIMSCMRFFISRHRMNGSLGVWRECFVGRVAQKEYHCNKHSIKSKDKQKRAYSGKTHCLYQLKLLNSQFGELRAIVIICLGSAWVTEISYPQSVSRQNCHCFSSNRQQNGNFRPPSFSLLVFTEVISQYVKWLVISDLFLTSSHSR